MESVDGFFSELGLLRGEFTCDTTGKYYLYKTDISTRTDPGEIFGNVANQGEIKNSFSDREYLLSHIHTLDALDLKIDSIVTKRMVHRFKEKLIMYNVRDAIDEPYEWTVSLGFMLLDFTKGEGDNKIHDGSIYWSIKAQKEKPESLGIDLLAILEQISKFAD